MKFLKIAVTAVLLCTLTVNAQAGGIFDIVKSFFSGGEATEDPLISDDITPPRGDKSPVKEETAETFSRTSQNWYFKHTKNGVRPPIPPEISYITSHGGYYLGADEPVIYLTFDAGYENGNIEKILDVLRGEEVPGAFFILENLVKSNTDLVIRMAEEGHTVCNHTASHKDMTTVSTKEDFAAELSKMEKIYKSCTGHTLAKFYRPPEGKLSEENLVWADELGYKTVLWSFAYADWDNTKQPDPESAKRKILSETHNGEIILLHPTSDTNAKILSDLIVEWKKMGYRFGSLDELGVV